MIFDASIIPLLPGKSIQGAGFSGKTGIGGAGDKVPLAFFPGVCYTTSCRCGVSTSVVRWLPKLEMVSIENPYISTNSGYIFVGLSEMSRYLSRYGI